MAHSKTSWRPGESGNPSGKPMGAKDKRTALRALFEPHAQELVTKAIELAKSGDTTALRLCLERLCPPLRAQDERVELPGFLATVSEQGAAVLRGVAAGDVSPDQGATLMQAIAAQARVVHVAELAERLEALERTLNRRPKG